MSVSVIHVLYRAQAMQRPYGPPPQLNRQSSSGSGPPPTPQPDDEDEMWRQRQRDNTEHVSSAVERARRRREDDERRVEAERKAAAQEKLRKLEVKLKERRADDSNKVRIKLNCYWILAAYYWS